MNTTGVEASAVMTSSQVHTFSIGERDFLLDGQPMVIRCGEMHFARVPEAYWRHRLKMLKAMGLNTVCAYLFWNFHERTPGHLTWSGEADAAAFCRMAQEEGLWVILRPGPYACAEWDGGGLPWWLLKHPSIHLRSQDPAFLEPARAWLKEVGRVLGPLQITRGGPIILVQVENEYGSYGKDADYMGHMRQATSDAGFDVPLFACNGPGQLHNGFRSDLLPVVNFGCDAAAAFARLREIQPHGPLMCGEFYPGWFDTWGAPHHLGKTPQFLADLEYMLKNRCSFSLYMAHGGTTFGLWAGADRPFKPDTSSYDYDAPISEAGWIGEKFRLTRELMAKHLAPGETLPDPPAPLPVMSVPAFRMTQMAPLLGNLPAPVSDGSPRHMEAYGQAQGCILYRTVLPAGPATRLETGQVGDFAWIFLDGVKAGIWDRRTQRYGILLPARTQATRLDILVEAMGHVNFGEEIHDRKGLNGPVTLGSAPLAGPWQVYSLPLDAAMLASLKWHACQPPVTTQTEPAASRLHCVTASQEGLAALPAETQRGIQVGAAVPCRPSSEPAFWKGTFMVDTPADTFLDLRAWGKGVVWVNGHCLARFWDIGPSQTAYLPGSWLKSGPNEVIILDLLGPREAIVAGLQKPINDLLRPERDITQGSASKAVLKIDGTVPAYSSAFKPGDEVQTIMLPKPVMGRQFCLETVNTHDGKPFAAIAELDLLDSGGKPLSHANWSIAYVDSEERNAEDGSASNAIDGQPASFWHTQWSHAQPGHPHWLVIDLGEAVQVGGFRYLPRAGRESAGHIKEYRIYIGSGLVCEPGP